MISVSTSRVRLFRGRSSRSLPPASAPFSVAILDINLDGQEIFPVAEIVAKRGLPFVCVTGYGENSLPPAFRGRPALQKPFQADALKTTLAGLLAKA